MKKLTKLFAIFILALSLAMLVSCGDDDDDKDNDDNVIDTFYPDYWGDGVEGPIIPYE